MVTTELFETVDIELGVDFFWRHRLVDGLYRAPNILLLPPYEGRYTGTQLNAELGWQVIRELSMTVYASRFLVARGLAEAGAQNASFLGFWSVASL